MAGLTPRAGDDVIDAAAPAVAVKGVSKSFGAARVLRDVSMTFRAGEIHALIGENGAGKSTLGKIIGGYYAADGGAVEVFGATVDQWSPRWALRCGIAMIHQELQLVPAMSVAQNVFLGIENNVAGILSADEKARFGALERRCGFGLDPDARVGSLRIAERQKVEIMRAMARNARVLIMDEPTSSLTADETDRLHQVMARLNAEGATIIYVTHFLDHVLAIANRVTILRDGSVVRTAEVRQETKRSLVEAMLGEPADVAYPELPPAPAGGAMILEVSHLSTQTGLRDISLNVRAGEVVGLIGLVGSGRTELARAIFGADKARSGAIHFVGESYTDPTPERSVARGLVLVPEDRRKQGLVLTQNVRPNVTLPHLGLFSWFGVLAEPHERRRTKELIDAFAIHPSDVDGTVALYSGGNQQKVLLSKWTCAAPRLIILDEPSRGVDIGARRRIHDFVVEAAAGGAGVLLISSELEEVMALSHRGYLMRDGRIVSELDPRRTTISEVLFKLFNITPNVSNEKAASA